MMNQAPFDKLIEKLECDCWELDGTIGFSAKLNMYQLSFYGNAEDNFQLIVEDFGLMANSRWFQNEPSPNQLAVMHKILHDKADELYAEQQEEIELAKDTYDVRAEQGLYGYGY